MMVRIRSLHNKDSPSRKGPTKENHKLTDYFNIRKSNRRTKGQVLEYRRMVIEFALRKGTEDGLEIRYVKSKGRGIFATKNFLRGEFVVEYKGELIDIREAYKRETLYEKDNDVGCYMYYFKFQDRHYCVDATAETDKLGRLVNHSRSGNLVTRIMTINKVPRLALIAKVDIKNGEELLYDYGDRSKESLDSHPWLAF